MRTIESALNAMQSRYGIERKTAIDCIESIARSRNCTVARAAELTLELLREVAEGS